MDPLRAETEPGRSVGLRDFRCWNRLGIGAIVLVMPVTFAVAFVPVVGGVLSLVAFSAGVIMFVMAAFKIRTFRCPNCRGYFTVKHVLASNSFGRRCVHCGVAAYGAEARGKTEGQP